MSYPCDRGVHSTTSNVGRLTPIITINNIKQSRELPSRKAQVRRSELKRNRAAGVAGAIRSMYSKTAVDPGTHPPRNRMMSMETPTACMEVAAPFRKECEE